MGCGISTSHSELHAFLRGINIIIGTTIRPSTIMIMVMHGSCLFFVAVLYCGFEFVMVRLIVNEGWVWLLGF